MLLFGDKFAMGVLRDPVTATIGAIGAGTSLLGGLFGSSAADKAAKIQQQNATKVAGMAQQAGDVSLEAGKDSVAAGNAAAANASQAAGSAATGVQQATGTANNTLGGVVNLETSNLQPYLAAGAQGVNSLAGALAPGGSLTQQFSGPDPNNVSSTPEYQFQEQQGLQALQRSAAATGSLGTGGTLKAITQYGQGLASTSYQQAYNNALNTFQTNRNNALSGFTTLAGIGQGATANYQGALQNFGNQSSTNLINSGIYSGNADTAAAQYGGNATLQGAAQNLTSTGQNLSATKDAIDALTGGANAQAQGTVNSANAWSGALGGVSNAVTGGLTLGALLKNPGSTGVNPKQGVVDANGNSVYPANYGGGL